MDTYRDKFAVGDKVVWRNDYWAKHNDGKRRYGSGPFTIVAVEKVSDYELEGVGHTQFLRLKMGTFSGAYFRKVEG